MVSWLCERAKNSLALCPDTQSPSFLRDELVKFIESGRISPSSFHETFKDIYRTVEKTTKRAMKSDGQPNKKA